MMAEVLTPLIDYHIANEDTICILRARKANDPTFGLQNGRKVTLLTEGESTPEIPKQYALRFANNSDSVPNPARKN